MKKRRLFGVGAAALALAVGITSCQGLLYNNRPGQEIRFSASAANGAETKTEYAGSDEDGGVVNNRERINWKKDGTDQVKIYLFLDNAPDYFFEPGENDEISENAVSDYSVTLIGRGTGDDAYKSRGKLSAIGNTALRWVGIEDNVDVVDHWFYSVYPAKLSGWSVTPEKDNYPTATITFPDLSGQDGSMDYAYMAAVAGPYRTGKVLENRENEAGTVDLDYYPMVTTVYVTFDNKSKNIPKEFISLTVNDGYDQPLAGVYNLEYSEGGFRTVGTIAGEKRMSISLPKEEGKTSQESIPFFLIPRTYSAGELTLKIGNENYTLNKEILPFHKYNVTINEDGEIDVTKLTDGMIELIKKCCPYEIKYNYNLITNMDNASIRAALLESEELRNAFLDFIKNATSLNSNGKEIGCSIVEGDFNIFRNLESVDLMLSNNVTANLSNTKVKHLTIQHGLEIFVDNNLDLEDITIKNIAENAAVTISNCPKVTTYSGDDTGTKAKYTFKDMKGLMSINLKNLSSIDVENCESLTKIKMENAGNLEEIKLIDTPYFTEGTTQNVNQSVTVTLRNCSTKVTSATLNLNGKGNVTERTNSDNVKVQ